jgi:hydrogenase maturation protease
MTAPCSSLLVGLGSPYGDDQIGWCVADAIAGQHLPGLKVCRAGSPLDMLDWLSGVDRLIICDACQGVGPVGSWHRWCWPSAEIAPLKFGGSHDLGLAATLTLAEQLGQLPGQVTIWAVEGRAAQFLPPKMTMSPEVEQALPRIIDLIQRESSLPTAIAR